MMREEFRLNEVIVKEGVYQSWMYSICEGSVDIYTDYGTENEKKLVTLKKGQFFGEIGMIAAMPRTATVVAAAELVVLEQISTKDLEDYLKEHPEYLQPIMSSVSRRIRDLTEDMSGITQMTSALLYEEETENTKGGWLPTSVRKLLAKLHENKSLKDEYVVMRKRQQALTGEIPSVIRLSAGNVIFRADEQADCMYDISEGCVGIYSDYQTESEKLLTKLYVDDVFGEMGILDDMPRSATAVCLTDCSLLVVKAETFMQYFQNKPAKSLKILQQMCMRLRNLTETYLQVCKTLEELPSLMDNNCQENMVLAKLEHIRQSQLCAYMYDASFGAERWYDHF